MGPFLSGGVWGWQPPLPQGIRARHSCSSQEALALGPPVSPAADDAKTTWLHGQLQFSQEPWRPTAEAWVLGKDVAEVGAGAPGRRSGHHLYQAVLLLLY